MVNTTFHPYAPADALGSDRSSGDRLRHRQKVRAAIRDNIADIISEQSIIGQDRDRIVKVPIRGIREYRFIYGDNDPQVAQGSGDSEVGQVVGEAKQKGDQPVGAGDQPGIDYYETDITIDELIEMMFEDLALPDLERKTLREIITERQFKPKGYRKKGNPVQLSRRRTVKSRIRRKIIARGTATAALSSSQATERFPFRSQDLTYQRRKADPRPESNAVVFCIMDTSGSMDRNKKYLARSFFFLLYQFVRTMYQAVEVVFIAHDTTAQQVAEDAFFHKGSSGGTAISSGYQLTLDLIEEWYHPSLWNIYTFHCSDGDNFPNDNEKTVKLAEQLCAVCNLFGYGEIKPPGTNWGNSTMLKIFEKISAPNFGSIKIESKDEVWPAFRRFLSREKAAA